VANGSHSLHLMFLGPNCTFSFQMLKVVSSLGSHVQPFTVPERLNRVTKCLIRIRKVPSSNLNSFSQFSSGTPGDSRDNFLKQATSSSAHIVHNFLSSHNLIEHIKIAE
jgi:hypothetical protein